MVASSLVPLPALNGTLLSSAAATPGHTAFQARKGFEGMYQLCAADKPLAMKMLCSENKPEAANFGKYNKLEAKDGLDTWTIIIGAGVSCKFSTKPDCACAKADDCLDMEGEG